MDLSPYKDVRLLLDEKGNVILTEPQNLPEYVSKIFSRMAEVNAFVSQGVGFNKVIDIKTKNRRELYFVQD